MVFEYIRNETNDRVSQNDDAVLLHSNLTSKISSQKSAFTAFKEKKGLKKNAEPSQPTILNSQTKSLPKQNVGQVPQKFSQMITRSVSNLLTNSDDGSKVMMIDHNELNNNEKIL
jgi:inorganic pyrophosphatase/exopolyphosphatase